MLGILFAFLAACANATSSVLQRRAGKEEGDDQEFSFRMILDLIRKPVWLLGILGVIAGFLLQAIALGYGQLAQVEPVLVLELPVTILLAWRLLDEGMSRLKGAAIVAMTIGLAGLIFFLSPSAGNATGIPLWKWGIALGAGFALVGGLGWWGQRTRDDMARAAVLGTATGAGFGMTAGLMKGMTEAASHGFLNIFTAWQTYLMVVAGGLSMWLLQNAMAAGKLVAAQPGFTLTDPVVAILWGIFIFDERVRTGWFMVLAVLSFALMVGSVIALSQTEEVQDDSDQDGGDQDDDGDQNDGEQDGDRQNGGRQDGGYGRGAARRVSGATRYETG